MIKMSLRTLFSILWLGLLIVTFSSERGSAAMLSLSSMNQSLTTHTEPYTAEKVKPAGCDSLNLDDAIIADSGTFSDTGGTSSLLIGSSESDTIYGLDEADCLFGGSGTNILDGGSGNDVCIGGSGNDVFSNCETCYQGGGGLDATIGCTVTYD
jgi:Ca2+-binding RTX toxin-like protein